MRLFPWDRCPVEKMRDCARGPGAQPGSVSESCGTSPRSLPPFPLLLQVYFWPVGMREAPRCLSREQICGSQIFPNRRAGVRCSCPLPTPPIKHKYPAASLVSQPPSQPAPRHRLGPCPSFCGCCSQRGSQAAPWPRSTGCAQRRGAAPGSEPEQPRLTGCRRLVLCPYRGLGLI